MRNSSAVVVESLSHQLQDTSAEIRIIINCSELAKIKIFLPYCNFKVNTTEDFFKIELPNYINPP